MSKAIKINWAHLRDELVDRLRLAGRMVFFVLLPLIVATTIVLGLGVVDLIIN